SVHGGRVTRGVEAWRRGGRSLVFDAAPRRREFLGIRHMPQFEVCRAEAALARETVRRFDRTEPGPEAKAQMRGPVRECVGRQVMAHPKLVSVLRSLVRPGFALE